MTFNKQWAHPLTGYYSDIQQEWEQFYNTLDPFRRIDSKYVIAAKYWIDELIDHESSILYSALVVQEVYLVRKDEWAFDLLLDDGTVTISIVARIPAYVPSMQGLHKTQRKAERIQEITKKIWTPIAMAIEEINNIPSAG